MKKKCIIDIKPKISIIVVDYWGRDYLENLFRSLLVQSLQDFEIIVVDNGNKLALPKTLLRTRIIRPTTRSNIGFAGGCNLGAKNSYGDFLVFLNNDTQLDENWLSGLLSRIYKDDSIGSVVSKILFFPHYTKLMIESPTFVPAVSENSRDFRELGVRIRFEPKWKRSTSILCQRGFHGVEMVGEEEWHWSGKNASMWIPVSREDECSFKCVVDTPIESTGQKFRIGIGSQKCEFVIDGEQHAFSFKLVKSDIFNVINSAGSELDNDGECFETGIYEIDSGQYDNPREVTAFSGCSVMIRKKVFEQLGGFDPAFFAYYEDTDLSWRMRKAGWKIMYEPKSVVRHHRSSTSGEQSPFFCYHIYRNKRWNIAKNARIGKAVSMLIRECLCWIPQQVNTNEEFSAWRLKRETILGMMRYLLKRTF